MTPLDQLARLIAEDAHRTRSDLAAVVVEATPVLSDARRADLLALARVHLSDLQETTS